MPVERTSGGTSLIDVLDRVLDKGIVIDAWVRVSLVGIDLITVEARVVVASIETYLKYSEAVGSLTPASRPAIDGHPHRSRAHRHTRRARPARPVVHARSRSPGRSAGCRQHRRRSERLRRERPPGAPDAARVGPFHRRPAPRASDARGVPGRP